MRDLMDLQFGETRCFNAAAISLLIELSVHHGSSCDLLGLLGSGCDRIRLVTGPSMRTHDLRNGIYR